MPSAVEKKNTLPKSNFSEERIYWVYTSMSQAIIEGKDLEGRSACYLIQRLPPTKDLLQGKKGQQEPWKMPLAK